MLKHRPWILTEQNMPYLFEKIKGLDKSVKWEVIIQEHIKDRSLQQNSRLWVLYESIGNYLGYTKDEMHDYFGNKFLKYQTVINGEVVERIESTTKLKADRMAWYQQQIEFVASQMGWGGLDG